MILGAILDAGIDSEEFLNQIDLLPLKFKITTGKTNVHGINATDVEVVPLEKKLIRSLQNIKKIISECGLPKKIIESSLQILDKIANAEANVHGIEVNKVHFHEIGGIDTIVDIVGSVIGLNLLKIDKVLCSPIATGYGTVKTLHGILPVPAPATIEILKKVPVYSGITPTELTTPTGAAIISHFTNDFCPIPEMKIEKIAYGAGKKQLDNPNVLRMFIGEARSDLIHENLFMISTNIDNLNPELYQYVIEKLLQAGANDAWITPILMKKGRNGTSLEVLVSKEYKDSVIDIIFNETSSLGIRIQEVDRLSLKRKNIQVDIGNCKINVKIGLLNGKVANIGPEYEDCKKAAKKLNLPLKEIYQLATDKVQKTKLT